MAGKKRSNRTTVKYLNYEVRCKICKRSANERKLHNAIINSKKFFPNDKEALSLQRIGEEFDLNYLPLLNHASNHITISPDDIVEIELKRISDRQAAQDRLEEARLSIKLNTTLGLPTTTSNATDVWDEVIDKAREGISDGSIKLNANHLLKAAKDKSDYEIKKKNQDIAIQEMMWHFASGEALGSGNYDRKIIEGQEAEDYIPSEVFTGHLNSGEARSSDLYSGTSGDAPTPRTDQVPEGDDF